MIELYLATEAEVLMIQLRPGSTPKKPKKKKRHTGTALLLDQILRKDSLRKLSFNIDRFVCSLYKDHSLTISNVIDLLDTSTSSHESLQAWMDVLGGDALVHKEKVQSLLHSQGSSEASIEDLALLSWAASHAIQVPRTANTLSQAKPINTTMFTPEARIILF